MVETLGVAKALTALTGAATGAIKAVPVLVQNSAVASQQVTATVVPLVGKVIGSVGVGLAALSALGAKSAAAAKTLLAPAAVKTATVAPVAKFVTDAAGTAVATGATIANVV